MRPDWSKPGKPGQLQNKEMYMLGFIIVLVLIFFGLLALGILFMVLGRYEVCDLETFWFSLGVIFIGLLLIMLLITACIIPDIYSSKFKSEYIKQTYDLDISPEQIFWNKELIMIELRSHPKYLDGKDKIILDIEQE